MSVPSLKNAQYKNGILYSMGFGIFAVVNLPLTKCPVRLATGYRFVPFTPTGAMYST
jgi:hypothetical protein